VAATRFFYGGRHKSPPESKVLRQFVTGLEALVARYGQPDEQ
jgi:hypothetical protein